MAQQQTGQRRPIILEIVAEDKQDADPAAIGEMGRCILDEVKQDGSKVKSVYTGQRGGPDLLFEIFTQLHNAAQVVGTDIYAQRDVIGEVASLIAIFDFTRPLALKIFKAREKQEAKQAVVTGTPPSTEEQHHIKLSMMIDGEPITVEADNFKDAQAMLELAIKVHAEHPNVKATSQSQVKMHVSVPKKQPRNKR